MGLNGERLPHSHTGEPALHHTEITPPDGLVMSVDQARQLLGIEASELNSEEIAQAILRASIAFSSVPLPDMNEDDAHKRTVEALKRIGIVRLNDSDLPKSHTDRTKAQGTVRFGVRMGQSSLNGLHREIQHDGRGLLGLSLVGFNSNEAPFYDPATGFWLPTYSVDMGAIVVVGGPDFAVGGFRPERGSAVSQKSAHTGRPDMITETMGKSATPIATLHRSSGMGSSHTRFRL